MSLIIVGKNRGVLVCFVLGVRRPRREGGGWGEGGGLQSLLCRLGDGERCRKVYYRVIRRK